MNNSLTLSSLAIAVSLLGGTATAAEPAWKNLGPSPPAIEASIAVDPTSGTMYVGTFGGGVLKSMDHGATFAAANIGLGNLAVTSMAMDPRNPNHVVVGTAGSGIFRTVNGGATWTATSDVGTVPVSLAVDPLDPEILYAGYGVGNNARIKKSVNGGADWSKADIGLPPTTVWSIVADPKNAGVVYAGTGNAGAFKSTNGGASWSALPIQPVVWSLAIDPQDSDVIYAGVNGDGVLKSTDAGATFSRVGTPEVGVVLALVVDPTDSQRIYAGTISGGVEMSDNGGTTWKKTSILRGIAIALSVTREGTVCVGTAFDGAFISNYKKRGKLDDRSLRFSQIANEELRAINAQNVYSVTIDPRDSNHLILGTNDGGLLATIDGGIRWYDAGKGFLNRAPRKAVFDPKNIGHVWVGSFDGGGLYSSVDNGNEWNRHMFGSPAIYVWTVAIDPYSGAIYAGTKGEGLWRSTDAGATFSRIDGSLIPQVRSIAFDISMPGKIYVASIGGLWRSLDGGAHFAKVATPATLTVLIDSTNTNVVYAGTQSLGVYKSVDGGATFVASNIGLTNLRTSRSGGVAIDPTSPTILYAGTEGGGVFKSENAGATWFAVNTGLTELNVFGLAIDMAHPNVLYVTGPQGVFKTETRGQ
jgi:photosystem II stability/assembly factor-like uncharacterized protein